MMKMLITGGSGFIGTHLVEHLRGQKTNCLNIDIKGPALPSHRDGWKACDILDRAALFSEFARYQPTEVVHLAARTDMEGRDLESYRTNTEGTANLLAAVKATPSVRRVIITSSQFVHQSGGFPGHDADYAPHTLYGESKVIAEQMTRQADLPCTWTIIRPTNIWGPWHPRYAKEFWLVLKRGFYLHPGREPVIRSYGYVGNVVHQIRMVLEAPAEQVQGRVFYVGDRPMNLLDWVNGFAKALNGREVKIVPRPLVRSLARFGDLLARIHCPFPLTSSRFASMTTDNPAPMEATFQALGESPYSLAEGIKETVQWLREQDPHFS